MDVADPTVLEFVRNLIAYTTPWVPAVHDSYFSNWVYHFAKKMFNPEEPKSSWEVQPLSDELCARSCC